MHKTFFLTGNNPMIDEIQKGELVRLLIENTNRSKLTTRREVRSILKIEKHNMNLALDCLCAFLNELGLSLAAPSSIYESDVFFLIRDTSVSHKKPRGCNYSKSFYRTVIAVTLIHLENKSVELDRFLEKLRRIFGEKDAEETLSELKRMRYIKVEKSEENMVVFYGWRYYLDFADFNPLEFFST